MKNQDMRNERLAPLSSMKDYKVAKEDVDVVGWRVVGADGETLGTVKDLIVDPQVMKVRYLSVLAGNKFFNTDRDQHILVPIGAAALDKKGKNLFVSYIDSRTIRNYPVYGGDSIPEDYEYAVRDSLQRAQTDTLPDSSERRREEFDEKIRESRNETRPIQDDFYENEAYNENRFYTSDEKLSRDKSFTTTDNDRNLTTTDTNRTFTTTDNDSTLATTDNDRTLATTDMNEGSRSKTVEDSIETIERLENLRKRGSITEEEFILMKKRALNL